MTVSAAPAAESAKRFVAFISYAHVDEAFAAKLHKQIETYRLPNQLQTAGGGNVAGRLGKVFRDRADLAAADSLSEAIRAALADSSALIVLCSPAAVQSRWVNEEIRLFRALNPGAPVLAVVARGEPVDAMPAALTEGGREPLAADLRDQGDGRKLGFLKIIAALAGIPLDALIQRDAQRKLRRVMAVTAGALVALVAAVSMMTYAIQQRNEAQRQRAQAEGLVEFMLTDLRESLRGVGRLDIMRSAADNALNSFSVSGERSSLSPDSRGQLARLLLAVGEDALSQGNVDEAQRAIMRAHGITADLLADAPRDADRIFNHAQSEFWAGRLTLTEPNQAQRTEAHWRRYRALARRLAEVEPASQRSLQEQAYADGNLCTLGLVQRQNSIGLCETAVSSQRMLASAYPDDESVTLTLANRLAWLAEAKDRAQSAGRGNRERAEQLQIVRSLIRRDPNNWELREFLARALIAAVAGAHAAGNSALAEARTTEARAVLRSMRAHDPANQAWAELAEVVD